MAEWAASPVLLLLSDACARAVRRGNRASGEAAVVGEPSTESGAGDAIAGDGEGEMVERDGQLGGGALERVPMQVGGRAEHGSELQVGQGLPAAVGAADPGPGHARVRCGFSGHWGPGTRLVGPAARSHVGRNLCPAPPRRNARYRTGLAGMIRRPVLTARGMQQVGVAREGG